MIYYLTFKCNAFLSVFSVDWIGGWNQVRSGVKQLQPHRILRINQSNKTPSLLHTKKASTAQREREKDHVQYVA